MHRILSLLIFLSASLLAWSNDGVFFVNGNHLVPVQETDISLTREVLTISLGDDGYAEVDVQYTLSNPGKEKTVVMGFEANAPYNDDVPFSHQGIHPYISDFTVEMNGSKLTYMNAVVKSEFNVPGDFRPLDLNQWKAYGEVKMKDGEDLPNNSMLYDLKQDSLIGFSYAYYFVARFLPGENTVHHTYRYLMSYGVGRTFEVPYWLLPAMRWANRQIDDFTLRIKTPGTAKHFFLSDSVFTQAPFVITEGAGKLQKARQWDESCTEIALRNGTVEWHATNFRPKADMTIQSAERLHYDHFILGTFYDRSDRYIPGSFLFTPDSTGHTRRILENLPYAHRGYVFKDKKLRKYFSQFFWYIPDPAYLPSTSDFTPREWQLIGRQPTGKFPELEFVMQLKVRLGTAYSVGDTPHGRRTIVPITGGSFEGPLLRGTIIGGGADYQLRNPDGRTELEAIYSIKTCDGVYIHVRNRGLVAKGKDSNGGLADYFKAAPQFEAPADSKYSWLNNALFVCEPEFSPQFAGGVILNIWKVK